MVLDWKPVTQEEIEKPYDPVKASFQILSKKELGKALLSWRTENWLTLRQAAKMLQVPRWLLGHLRMERKGFP